MLRRARSSTVSPASTCWVCVLCRLKQLSCQRLRDAALFGGVLLLYGGLDGVGMYQIEVCIDIRWRRPFAIALVQSAIPCWIVTIVMVPEGQKGVVVVRCWEIGGG